MNKTKGLATVGWIQQLTEWICYILVFGQDGCVDRMEGDEGGRGKGRGSMDGMGWEIGAGAMATHGS